MPSLDRSETDSLYCNPTEDGESIMSSSGGAPSIKSTSSPSATSSLRSGSQSIKSKTASTKSKSSSYASVPKSPQWKAAVDPLGMSSKAVGFMPMFSTHLYAPGFQTAVSTSATNANEPKAYQSKQLTFVEKKKSFSSSSSSTKSNNPGKSEKTKTAPSNNSVKSLNSLTKSTFSPAFASSLSTQDEHLSNFPDKRTVEETKSLSSNSRGGDEEIKEEIVISRNSKEIEGTEALATTATTAVIISATETVMNNDIDSAYGDSDDMTFVNSSTEVAVLMEAQSLPDASIHPFDKTVVTTNTSSDVVESINNQNILCKLSTVESTTQLRSPPISISTSAPRPTHTPNELILKRMTSWEYIGRVYHGKMAYYNTILLTEADLRKFYTPEVVHKRTQQYFMLGTSIANILEIPHLPDFVKSLSAVLQEFEHFQSSETKSKMSFLKNGWRVHDGKFFEETSEYTHFETRSLPFEMDYIVIFATLCEMIAQAYKKFDTYKANIIMESDMFHKIDIRFKKILSTTTRELDNLARETMQEELYSIDPIAGLTIDWNQQVLSIGN
ncbi:hypothetical protein BX616_007793 [Lobosporangium transversale]|uniref:Uncharacterized protein n=1 Tax=Lobosporangium transversale TaxID=64571 RepID=A0A1Y2GXC6_9FUNG|nr:hypothetical protein BCR41DRAFT_320021 [Lobosporangium transversale]KAF9914680.1 hypothetical protein BX616_007793 [Lobosporangium transversale]ORZ22683.1 hypothetical protein BCR41DRAFT_320021 [Lobosporangium transversale]|eukprot:XP_021883237.1 hypothetical protein BCR41DRAFT_320021 [Lobosporangium transversale]